jgi:hypothetical protein
VNRPKHVVLTINLVSTSLQVVFDSTTYPIFPSGFPNTTVCAFVLFYASYNSRFCHFPLFVYFSVIWRTVSVRLKNMCIYTCVNIMLGSKERSEIRFYQAAVFHSRKVDVPAEKFRQHLLLSTVIFLPSEQSVTSARLYLCLLLSRNSFDGSEFQNADRHPLLYPFSSFPLRWNKTYYNIDHTHPYVALYCTRNCESCFAVSLFLTPERCPESALCW